MYFICNYWIRCNIIFIIFIIIRELQLENNKLKKLNNNKPNPNLEEGEIEDEDDELIPMYNNRNRNRKRKWFDGEFRNRNTNKYDTKLNKFIYRIPTPNYIPGYGISPQYNNSNNNNIGIQSTSPSHTIRYDFLYAFIVYHIWWYL